LEIAWQTSMQEPLLAVHLEAHAAASPIKSSHTLVHSWPRQAELQSTEDLSSGFEIQASVLQVPPSHIDGLAPTLVLEQASLLPKTLAH
jgi:hypothetical protein